MMRILALAPHTDDAEFGCGGTLSRCVEEGHRVSCVAFSAAEQAVQAPWPRDVLRAEIKSASRILGIMPDDLYVLSYPVREFWTHRQAILDDMILLRDKIAPDVVFLPSVNDTHQDHQVIAQEGFRAFKNVSMLGYELPWNNLHFSTNCFVVLDARHIQKKVEAVQCYASQALRTYASDEFVRSLARTRGTQIGAIYSEAFEVVRLVSQLPLSEAAKK